MVKNAARKGNVEVTATSKKPPIILHQLSMFDRDEIASITLTRNARGYWTADIPLIAKAKGRTVYLALQELEIWIERLDKYDA